MDFKDHLKTYLSDKDISLLLNSINQKNYKCVLLNTKKLSCANFINLYPHVKKHPIVENCFIYDPEEYSLGKSIFHELGCYYIQEPSAAVVSYLLDAKPGEFVLDLCAAPGGKTVQSSWKMNGEGLIISNDISRERALSIKENSERMGLSNLLIISNDFSKIYTNFEGVFDKIILDAPCSGSGMFKKSKEMQEDWSYSKVLKFASIQKDLIILAYKMLKPGGTLSYSTCSFSKEEDEDIISYLFENSDAELVDINDNPLFTKGVNNLGIHLLPHVFPGDGHYICFVKKPGQLKNTSFEKNNVGSIKVKDLTTNLYLTKFGDCFFGLRNNTNTKYFSIIRYGVKIGEQIKDYLKLDVHYARSIQNYKNEIELSDIESQKYILGESINKISDKGNILLKYKGIPIDFGKSDGKIIKNHYPKYLRKKVNFQ